MNNTKPFPVDTGKGFSLKYKNRNLYSTLKPLETVIRKVERLSIQEETLLFVPSILLGYGLHELAEALPGNCHILCIETDRVLWDFSFSQTLVKLPVHKKITFHFMTSPAELARLLETLKIHRFRRVLMARLSGGYQLDSGGYNRILTLLESQVRTFWQNKITLMHMGPLWIKNIFKNLASGEKSFTIRDFSSDKPLLITGAGPSLEDNLELIGRIRHEVTLITVDTALPVLVRHGITPDFIFVMEAQLANLYDFIHARPKKAGILCDLTSYPRVLRLFPGRVWLYCSSFHKVELFKRLETAALLPPMIPPLGSVGIGALYLGRRLSSGPLFFTGLDFSYTKKKTHAGGAPFHTLELLGCHRLNPMGDMSFKAIRRRPLLKMAGKGGSEVLTDLVLNNYREKARDFIKKEKNIYDLSTLGLDLGAPFAGGLNDIMKLFDSPCGKKNGSPDGFSKGRVKKFFKSECELLKEGINFLTCFLDPQESIAFDRGVPVLKALDYVWLHFPEEVDFHDPSSALQTGLLFRILISCKYYLQRIDQVLGRLDVPE